MSSIKNIWRLTSWKPDLVSMFLLAHYVCQKRMPSNKYFAHKKNTIWSSLINKGGTG